MQETYEEPPPMPERSPVEGWATVVQEAPGGTMTQYHLDPPLDGSEHVLLVSIAPDDRIVEHEEVYVLDCDAQGVVTNWQTKAGSYRGGVDHRHALNIAGYSLVGAAG